METATHETAQSAQHYANILQEISAKFGGTRLHSIETRQQYPVPQFTPLAQETRTHINTREAAHFLNRREQTLRGWSCHEDGPVRPTRINGRLMWSVASIKKLLGV